MESDLAPIDLAVHWPYLAGELQLDRWRPAAQALELLALHQVRSRGAPVTIGPTFVRQELGGSAGQAHGVVRALRELARRRVVARFERPGGEPDAWSFDRAPVQWRGVAWRWSRREADERLRHCARSRDCLARPRENPGPESAPGPDSRHFALSAEAHLGFYPVDFARSYPESRGRSNPSRDFAPVAAALSFLPELRNVDVGTLAIAERIRELDSRGLGLSPVGWRELGTVGELTPTIVAFVCARLADFGTRVPDRQIPNVRELVSQARAEEHRRSYFSGPSPFAAPANDAGPERLSAAGVIPGLPVAAP